MSFGADSQSTNLPNSRLDVDLVAAPAPTEQQRFVEERFLFRVDGSEYE